MEQSKRIELFLPGPQPSDATTTPTLHLFGALGETRTPDFLFRRQTLCSTELQGHSNYFITVIVTLHTPTLMHPIALAAPRERSIDLPLTNGPRSLILTTTLRPL